MPNPGRIMTEPFSHFVGIDWSGAKGRRHGGIAVAICAEGEGAPSLVAPPDGKRLWSREVCARWIAGGCGLRAGERALVGLDSAFSMPFIDQGGYLGADFAADTVMALWQAVEKCCATGEDLFAGAFVDRHQQHYHRPGDRGENFSRRMRITETRAVESGAGPCESVFHLIGPSQVGLAGLSSMRMLAHFKAQNAQFLHTSVQSGQALEIAVWPYDVSKGAAVTLVEIYAAAFAAMGGHRGKIRDAVTLSSVLEKLDSKTIRFRNESLGESFVKFPSDHACDALITSAALRHISGMRKYWHPPQLSTMVRRTEGWVFGIL